MEAAPADAPMRPLIAALAMLLLLTFLPAPASAQQQGAVTVQLNVPETPLADDLTRITFAGIVTFTTDVTASASTTGIPVSYTVTKQPEWASVIISPATDVFSFGMPTGLSMTATKTVTIVVSLAKDPGEDLNGVIEITAETSPGPFGASFTGKGSTPIAYDAPEEEPCAEGHLVTNADWEAMAVEAADAYNEYQASKAEEDGGDEVSVQTGGASTLPMPWLIVGGFALIGAGVGLVLRRRLS